MKTGKTLTQANILEAKLESEDLWMSINEIAKKKNHKMLDIKNMSPLRRQRNKRKSDTCYCTCYKNKT